MKINNRYLLRGTQKKSNKTVWWFIYFLVFMENQVCQSNRLSRQCALCGFYSCTCWPDLWGWWQKLPLTEAGLSALFAPSAERSKELRGSVLGQGALAVGYETLTYHSEMFPCVRATWQRCFGIQHGFRNQASSKSVRTHPKTSRLTAACSSRPSCCCCCCCFKRSDKLPVLC